MKSEPSECSFESVLEMPQQTVPWFGVRNYQARNFMRDQMTVGDSVLFYHSSCAYPGIAGLAHVASSAHPDETQFDQNSVYFDPKSSRQNPRWVCVDVRADEAIELIGISELRKYPELAQMRVLQKGNRLSITPVTKEEYLFSKALLIAPGRAFTESGARLGRGKGFYDEYIRKNKDRLFTLGVCFSIQLFKTLPVDANDQKIDLIISGGEGTPA